MVTPFVIQLWKKLDAVVAQLKYEYLRGNPPYQNKDGYNEGQNARARHTLNSLRLTQMQRRRMNSQNISQANVSSTSSQETRSQLSHSSTQPTTCSNPVISPKRKSVTPRKKRIQDNNTPLNLPPSLDVPLLPEELVEFPQILESLLSDATISEKLAGTINKVRPAAESVSGRLESQNTSGQSSARMIAQEKSAVDKRAVDEAIEMTCSDPAFDSLFSLFNLDRAKFMQEEKERALQTKNSQERESIEVLDRRVNSEISHIVVRDLFTSNSRDEGIKRSQDVGVAEKEGENQSYETASEIPSDNLAEKGGAINGEGRNEALNVDDVRTNPKKRTSQHINDEAEEDETMDVNEDEMAVTEVVESDAESHSSLPQSEDVVMVDNSSSENERMKAMSSGDTQQRTPAAVCDEGETTKCKVNTPMGIDSLTDHQSEDIREKSHNSSGNGQEDSEPTSNADHNMNMHNAEQEAVEGEENGKGQRSNSCFVVLKKTDGDGGKDGKKSRRRRERNKESQGTRRSQRLEAKKQQTSANSPNSTVDDEDEDEDEQCNITPRTPSSEPHMMTTDCGLQAANEYAKKLLASMPDHISGGGLNGLSPVALNVTVSTASPLTECLPDPFETSNVLSTKSKLLAECMTVATLTSTTSSVLSTRQNSEITTTQSKSSNGKVTVLTPAGKPIGVIQLESVRKEELLNLQPPEKVSSNDGGNGNLHHSQQSKADLSKNIASKQTGDKVSTDTSSDGIVSSVMSSESSHGTTSTDTASKTNVTGTTALYLNNSQAAATPPPQYIQIATALATNPASFALTSSQQQLLLKNSYSIAGSQCTTLPPMVRQSTVLQGVSAVDNSSGHISIINCLAGNSENGNIQAIVSDGPMDWANNSQVIMLQAADSLLSLGVVQNTNTNTIAQQQGPGEPVVIQSNRANLHEVKQLQVMEAMTSTSDVQVKSTTSQVPPLSKAISESSETRTFSKSVSMAPESVATVNVKSNAAGNHLNLDQQGVTTLMNEELERSLLDASTQDIDFIFKAITMTPQKDIPKDGVKSTLKEAKKYSPLEKVIADKLKRFAGSEYQVNVEDRNVKEKVSPWKNAALQSQTRYAKGNKCVRKVFTDEGEMSRDCHVENVGGNQPNHKRPNEADVRKTRQKGSDSSHTQQQHPNGDKSSLESLPNSFNSNEKERVSGERGLLKERDSQGRESTNQEERRGDAYRQDHTSSSVNESEVGVSTESDQGSQKCNKEGNGEKDLQSQKRKLHYVMDKEKQQKLERRMRTRLKENHQEQRGKNGGENDVEIRTSAEKKGQCGDHIISRRKSNAATSNQDDQERKLKYGSRVPQGTNREMVDKGPGGQEMPPPNSIKQGNRYRGKEDSRPTGSDLRKGSGTREEGIQQDASRIDGSNSETCKKSQSGKDDKDRSRETMKTTSEKERKKQISMRRKNNNNESVGGLEEGNVSQEDVIQRLNPASVKENQNDHQSDERTVQESRGLQSDRMMEETRNRSQEDVDIPTRGKFNSGRKDVRQKYVHDGKDYYETTQDHRLISSNVTDSTRNVRNVRSKSRDRRRLEEEQPEYNNRRGFQSFSKASTSQLSSHQSPTFTSEQAQAEVDFMDKDYEDTRHHVEDSGRYGHHTSDREPWPISRMEKDPLNLSWDEEKEERRRESNTCGNSDESGREDRPLSESSMSSPISVTRISPIHTMAEDSCSRTRGVHYKKQNYASQSSAERLMMSNTHGKANPRKSNNQSDVSWNNGQSSQPKEGQDYKEVQTGEHMLKTSKRHSLEQQAESPRLDYPHKLDIPNMQSSRERLLTRKEHWTGEDQLQVRRNNVHESVTNPGENVRHRRDSSRKRQSLDEGHRTPRRRYSYDEDDLRGSMIPQDSGRFSMEGGYQEARKHIGNDRHHLQREKLLYKGSENNNWAYLSDESYQDSGGHSLDHGQMVENASDEDEGMKSYPTKPRRDETMSGGNSSDSESGNVLPRNKFDGALRNSKIQSHQENITGSREGTNFQREHARSDNWHQTTASPPQDYNSNYKFDRKHSLPSERHYTPGRNHRVRGREERPRNEGNIYSNRSSLEETDSRHVRHLTSDKVESVRYDRHDLIHQSSQADQGHHHSQPKASTYSEPSGRERSDRKQSHGERFTHDQRHRHSRSNEHSRNRSSCDESQEIRDGDGRRRNSREEESYQMSPDYRLHQNKMEPSLKGITKHQTSKGHLKSARTHSSMQNERQSDRNTEIGSVQGVIPPVSSIIGRKRTGHHTSERGVKRSRQETEEIRPWPSAKRKTKPKESSSQQSPTSKSDMEILQTDLDLRKLVARLKYV
ncbi:uncharacterized protein [Apostichopus japonicus]